MKLLVDCPLNGDGNDVSGNGNHLTAGSGVTWATVGERKVLHALNADSYFYFPTQFQNTWLNNFKLEIDIQKVIDTGNYPNYIDSCGSGGGGVGIGIYNQLESGIFNLGFLNIIIA